jgi:hypothetical protein
MLKKIALGGLFALGVALGMTGSVAAKTGAGKGAKVDLTTKAQGVCPIGTRC